MALFNRKVYIEFVSRDTCIITTLYKQKAFTFTFGKHGCKYVDLISLKEIPEKVADESPLYMLVHLIYDPKNYKKNQAYYSGEVVARMRPDDYVSKFSVNISNNKKIFRGNIWE